MKSSSFPGSFLQRVVLTALACSALAPSGFGQQVTFSPYIQLGDNGPFGPTDQIVIAWQTDEASPNASAFKVEIQTAGHAPAVLTPSARVVDNYLAADPALPTVPGAYGAHSDYTAVARNLRFDAEYQYRVTGPGMPTGGFTASFHTRKQGPVFSFAVEGDEGFFPVNPNANPPLIVDYEARIAHLINNAASIQLPNQPSRPAPDLILNTGDNVYNEGSEDNYRDFFFPVLNSDQDSNETGAPILRSKLFFPVDGNHDVGSTGVTVNMLADNSAPAFSGNTSGGDAMAYFNNFYFPQNGPQGFDIENAFNGDTASPTGFVYTFQGNTFTAPAATAAFRSSTTVDTGAGPKAQIDHQSNFSFDYGNAHFLFLDANPHLFNDNLPSTNAFNAPPPNFTAYPSGLATFIANDLDSSKQLWKIVVFHQPAFTSGDATIVNNQMRAVAKLVEDHGANIVFNGHDHNYQRSLPLRATARTAGPVSTTAGSPAVFADANFDGASKTVPDGVLYIVEGAGGNRDFDGDFAPPRGSGLGLDQDDSATGIFTDEPGLTVPQGPASWLDTNLTNPEMINFFANAGQGQKITTRLKAKVFSFGHVVVTNNRLTLFQISEPLQATSSATSADPAPFGTDINGKPLNDPIPDTVINPATGQLVSSPATGTSALLDKWTLTKPEVAGLVSATISAPLKVRAGQAFNFSIQLKNNSQFSLNGTQVRFALPANVSFAGAGSNSLTLQGNEVVVTVGRLATGTEQTISIPVLVSSGSRGIIQGSASVFSSTALPVASIPAVVVVLP